MKAIISALVVTTMMLCSSAKADVGEIGHYFYDGGVGAGAVVTLLPQSSNVNGAVLRTCAGVAIAGGGVYIIVDQNTPNDASIGAFR